MGIVQREETVSEDVERPSFSGSTEVYVVVEGVEKVERATLFEEGLEEMDRLMTYIGENFPPASVVVGLRVIRHDESSRIGDDFMPNEPGTIMRDLAKIVDELRAEAAARSVVRHADPNPELTAELASIAGEVGGVLFRGNEEVQGKE